MTYPPQQPPRTAAAPAGWPPVPPQPAPKKTNRAGVGVAIAAIVTGVLVILCLAGGISNMLGGTTAGGTATDGPTGGGITTAPEAPEKPKKWTKVAALSGSNDKRSAPFRLAGGRTRLTYDVKGADPLVVAIYVMEKGTSLEKDGGFPEVMPDSSGKDSTELSKDAGEYYLEVMAANAQWTVTIEELR